MEHGGGVLFHVGPLGINSVMVTTTSIVILLTLFSWLATRKMAMHPKGVQNVAEIIVEMLDNFIGGILGPALNKHYFPLLATLFLFILISNYSGLLPLAGTLPGLAAPTSTLSVTVALACIAFVSTHYAGVKSHGAGYLKHFITPFAFLLPLMIIEEMVRPLSLSLRLFGNIFGEETVTHTLFGMVPLGIPVLMQAFGLLMGGIQAMVFVLLTAIYIQQAGETSHD